MINRIQLSHLTWIKIRWSQISAIYNDYKFKFFLRNFKRPCYRKWRIWMQNHLKGCEQGATCTLNIYITVYICTCRATLNLYLQCTKNVHIYSVNKEQLEFFVYIFCLCMIHVDKCCIVNIKCSFFNFDFLDIYSTPTPPFYLSVFIYFFLYHKFLYTIIGHALCQTYIFVILERTSYNCKTCVQSYCIYLTIEYV
jgi:hypothetical protein